MSKIFSLDSSVTKELRQTMLNIVSVRIMLFGRSRKVLSHPIPVALSTRMWAIRVLRTISLRWRLVRTFLKSYRWISNFVIHIAITCKGVCQNSPFLFLCWPTYKVKSKKIVLYKIKLFLCKVTRFKRYYK